MNNKKNIALIGVGRWGKNHLKTLSSIKDVNKIFVVYMAFLVFVLELLLNVWLRIGG